MSQSTKAKKNPQKNTCTVNTIVNKILAQGLSSRETLSKHSAQDSSTLASVTRVTNTQFPSSIARQLLLLLALSTAEIGVVSVVLAEDQPKGDIRAQLKDTLTDESNQNISAETVSSVLEGVDPETEKEEQSMLDAELKPSPEEVSLREELNEFLQDFKKEANPLLILNRVDWEEAYRYLSPYRKQNLGLRSPNLARKYYLDYFTNPGALSSYLLARNISQLPEEKRQAVRMVYESEPVRRGPAKKVEGLENTRFRVSICRIEGDVAKVSLRVYKGKDPQDRNLTLRKTGENWLFICPYLIDDPLNLCDLAS